VLATCVALGSLALAAQPALGNHEGTPAGVSLVAEKDAVTIPESIKLIANADRHLYGTGYTVAVIDDDSGSQIGGACSQTPCAKHGGTSWADNPDPQPRHFHAELRGPGGGVVATSGQVTVEVRKHTWEIVSVVPDPQTAVVPGSIRFTATLDHTAYGTPYSIYIYDKDNPTSPTTCNQYICGKSISRRWADNVNPKPGRVRVEVRNSSGDVASNTVHASAVFRRFIFTPILSFWTQTGSNGHVMHKASARLAATDPSLYGTGYRIKIKKADGTQVCSASQVGCDATVTIGETYRAVVENGTGHVAGQSGAFTLTGAGPQLAAFGDLDLATLAALVAGAGAGYDLCTRLGLSTVRTNVVGPNTSGGDQWEICTAMAAAGASTLAILTEVAQSFGGPENLYWLIGDLIKESPEPETPPSSEDAKAPRPLPPPLLPEVEKLADTLVQQNPEFDQWAADDVARQCRFLHWKAGRSPDRCKLLPIFASGSDVAEATEHDLMALAGHWPWLLLNREQSSTKPGEGWQTTGGRCSPTVLRACHEYPFFGTEQGGPLASQRGPEPIIGLVLKGENSLQGTRYSQFVSACGMKTGTPDPTGATNSTGGDPFLSIPLPPEWNRPTLWMCNGKTE
jgi:hypothetical protein